MAHETLQSGTSHTGNHSPEDAARAPIAESRVSLQDIAALERDLSSVPPEYADAAAAAVQEMKLAAASGHAVTGGQMQLARQLVDEAIRHSKESAGFKNDVARDKLDKHAPAPARPQPRRAVRDLSFEEMISENVARMEASGTWGKEFTPDLIRMMYQYADYDNSGELNQHELIRFLRENGYGTKASIDTDGDGHASSAELAAAARNIQRTLHERALAQLPAVHELEEIVVTGTRRPQKNLDQLLTDAAQEAWDDKEIEAAYKFLDSNRSRKLSVAELRAGLAEAGLDSRDALDTDEDGRISAAELRAGLNEVARRRGNVSFDTHVRSAWEGELRQTDAHRLTDIEKTMLDRNGDGTISHSEVMEVLRQGGYTNTDAIDDDMSLKFERSEFLNALRTGLENIRDGKQAPQAAAPAAPMPGETASEIDDVVVKSSGKMAGLRFTTGTDAGVEDRRTISEAITPLEMAARNTVIEVSDPVTAEQAPPPPPVAEPPPPPSLYDAINIRLAEVTADDWAQSNLAQDLRYFDTNRDGQAKLDEIMQVLRQHNITELAHVDTDGDHKVSSAELFAALAPIAAAERANAEQLAAQQEQSRQREHDFSTKVASAWAGVASLTDITADWQRLDVNGDGQYTNLDAVALLHRHGITDIAALDSNGDGELDTAELKHGLVAALQDGGRSGQNRA